ncbi:hypothetical protein [Peribacillus glennii]|uniref:DUF4352 domain-containing protein n=1 Tax=Peribacillus glennii TaxID=2303991 RepID=A0A372L7G9_9BACI|nr:hypothetical protein [Peribacillus glennii]RFU61213.1 hypothetical protein D0466_18515 [Peribacillus glennii]
MKKYLLMCAAIFLLSGCGSDETATHGDVDQENETSDTQQQENEQVVEDEPLEEESKDTDSEGPLTEVGQTLNDEGVGTVTLKKISNVDTDYKMDDLTVHIDKAKLLSITNMTDEYKDNVGATSDEFTYLQVAYTVSNNSNETVDFSGFKTAVLDSGKQLNIKENDIIGSANPENLQILPKATLENNIFGIEVPSNLSFIRIKPEYVINEKAHKTNLNPKEIKIDFK